LDLPSAPERLLQLQAEEEDSGVMRSRRRRRADKAFIF
jgi:hypothetical protein